MAKVLIASLGTGQKQENGVYEYVPTEYFLSAYDAAEAIETDKAKPIKTKSMIYALKSFYNIERLILLGTTGSDWATLYEYLCKSGELQHQKEYDKAYHDELKTIFESRNLENYIMPDEMSEKLKTLEETFGDFCDSIHILSYGTNKTELDDNFLLMNEVANRLKDDDEVIFDISHAFRSLPFYELLVAYLTKHINKRKLKFKITYGMFEAKDRFENKTPIVDLSQFINIMDWIKAAEEYNRFGTARLLAELLEEGNLGFKVSREGRKALEHLGDTITGVERAKFISLVKRCVSITKGTMPKNTEHIIGRIFKDISDRFGDKLSNGLLLFAELAKWHYEYNRYIPCAITLEESMLEYCARELRINEARKNKRLWSWERYEKPFRASVRAARSENYFVERFVLCYNQVNDIRNHLAHGNSVTDGVIESRLEHFRNARANDSIKTALGRFPATVSEIAVELSKKENASELSKAIENLLPNEMKTLQTVTKNCDTQTPSP